MHNVYAYVILDTILRHILDIPHAVFSLYHLVMVFYINDYIDLVTYVPFDRRNVSKKDRKTIMNYKKVVSLALVISGLTAAPAIAHAQPVGVESSLERPTPLPTKTPSPGDEDNKSVSFRFTPLNQKVRDDIFKNRKDNEERSNSEENTSSSQSKTSSSRSLSPSRKTTTTTTTKGKKKKTTVTVTVKPTPEPEPEEDLIYPPEWDGYVDDETSGAEGVDNGSSVDLSSLNLGDASQAAKEAVKHAYEQLGTPYVWGGTTMSTPNSADGGLDCSGLTQGVYAQAGVSIPRVTYSQVETGTAVPMAQIQPGDLVFYSGIGHVAIYVGDGNVIHAPQPGEVVKVSPMNMMPVEAIRRVA